MSSEVRLSAVHRRLGLVLRDDGVLGDIREYLDADGDETTDPDTAACAIVEWRDGGFSPVMLDDFEPASIA